MLPKLSAFYLFALILLPAPILAQEENGLDATGFLRSYAGIGLRGDLDYMALRNRVRLNLTYNYDRGRIVLVNDLRHSFVGAVGHARDDPEFLYDLREAYVDLYRPHVDVRLGRQHIVWGEADGAFITDVLSPLDLSEFLTLPFEDIRLGIPAFALTYYTGDLALTGVAIPLPLPSRLPSADSPWNPVPASVGNDVQNLPVVLADAELPPTDLRSGEAAFRAAFYGVPLTTLTFIFANSWERIPAFRKYVDVDLSDGTPRPLSVRVAPSYYRRLVFGGTLSTAAIEPFIVRSELALHTRRAYDLDTAPPPSVGQIPVPPPGLQEISYLEAFNRQFVGFHPAVRMMVGAEASSGPHLFRVQLLNEIMLRTEERVLRDRIEPAVTGLWNARLLRDIVTTRIFAYYTIGKDFWFNPQLTYAVQDALNAQVGVHFFGGRAPADGQEELSFWTFRRNDFAYVRIQYSF